MRALRPSELAAILPELQTQTRLLSLVERRNGWNLLATVITNELRGIAGLLRKRKPKLVEPADFLDKQDKAWLKQLAAEPEAEKKWDEHIAQARAKGLRGI